METRYHIISDRDELVKLINCCKSTGYACCDYETNAEPIYNNGFKPTILSVSWMPGFGASILLDHPQTIQYASASWDWKKMLRKFGEEVIENPDITKVAWNWKFDDQINQKYNIYYRGVCLDGMLAKYILNEERPNDLKSMVRRYLPEHGNYEKQDSFDRIPWDQKELEPLCHYGCQDADYTLRLTIFFEKKLIDLGLYSVYRNMIMAASRVLTSVEKNGLYLDRDFNEKLLNEYGPRIEEANRIIHNLPKVKKFEKKYIQERVDRYIASIEAELHELDYQNPKDRRKILLREQKISNLKAGVFSTKKEQELIRPVNLGSTTDLPLLMYTEDGFNFLKIKTSEKGKPSTDEETLLNLRIQVKNPESSKAIFLDKLLELRGLQKMYATYIEGWHEKVQDDSCLHGRFLIHGTSSGRLSSADPNMQQIPKTSVDPNIKKQLVAPNGTLYLASDFSQAELRIMAHLSGDETYLSAFNSGQDPHLAIAATKYHIPYEEALKIYEDENHPDHGLWKVRRKQAKQIAFGLIYGIGAKLLAVKLSDPKAGIIITPEQAQQEMDVFFGQHPKLKTFLKKQEKFLKKNGYLMSLFGRKRRLPQIYSEDHGEQAYALRLALNFPCLLPTSQALCKTKGWVNSDNLEVGDEILAFNPRTGQSEWQPVLEIHTPTYDGHLYGFTSKHCGILSTDYHRWYVSKYNDCREAIKKRISQDLELKKFNDLKSSIYALYDSGMNLFQIAKELGISYTRVRRIYSNKTNSPLTGHLIEPFKVMTSKEIYDSEVNCKIPICSKHESSADNSYSSAFIALLGWYLTDATLRNGRVKFMQSYSANPNKVLHIQKLLKSSNLKYTEKFRVSKIGTVVSWHLDKASSEPFIKALPDRVLTMDFIVSLKPAQIEILLYNMRLGDGWSTLACSNYDQASLIQAMVVLSGGSSSMFRLSYPGKRSYFKDKKPSKLGQEYIEATKDSWGIKFSDRKVVHTKSYGKKLMKKVRYSGKVWCPSVPSGAFFTRYIGEDGRYRTMITGNCQSAASDMCLFGSILIYHLMKQGKLPYNKSVCLVHDANYQLAKPENINIWTIYEMWKIYRNPLTEPYFGFKIDDVSMDMDFVIGRTMAEELPFIPGYDYNKMLDPNFSVDEYLEEHKKYKHIPISEFKKRFNKQMKEYEEDFKRSHSVQG